MRWDEFADTCPELAALGEVSSRLGTEGDFKLYGRAVEVRDEKRRARYRATIKARIDWEPAEPTYHLFAISVDSAGFVVFDDDARGMAWTPAGGLRVWTERPE